MELQHYLLLDGAAIDNLIKIIYQLKKSAELDILYLNTRFAELQEVSPVLVKIRLDDELYKRFTAEWQKTAGIHLIAKSDIYTLGNHLRSSLQAKINGQPTLFRFYDPRILGLWFETITQEQRSQFMGTITTLFIPSQESDKITEYHNDNHVVCVTPNTIWIELNDKQLEHLTQAKKAQVTQIILNDLKEAFPQKMATVSTEQKQELIATSIKKAKQHGYDTPKDIYLWSIILLHKGLHFPEDNSDQVYQAILADKNYSPQDRLNNLLAELANQQQIA